MKVQNVCNVQQDGFWENLEIANQLVIYVENGMIKLENVLSAILDISSIMGNVTNIQKDFPSQSMLFVLDGMERPVYSVPKELTLVHLVYVFL